MLRFLLGDDLYRTTIRTYTQEHAFSAVETQDLMRSVREVTGENLDWFFEQWAFLAGYPKFRVTKDWNAASGILHLQVNQTQQVEGLVPVFRVPLDIELTWDGGSRVQRVVVDRASQDYYFPLPSEPHVLRRHLPPAARAGRQLALETALAVDAVVHLHVAPADAPVAVHASQIRARGRRHGEPGEDAEQQGGQ
jgi:aminopeptidase N